MSQATHLKCIKLFALFFLVLLVLPLVSAQSPFNVQTNVLTARGIDIQYPPNGLLQQNQDYRFNFHLYNISSGGFLTNETISCYFHLYNESGKHIVTGIIPRYDFDSDDRDYFVDVEGENFSSVGEYSYLVDCNASAEPTGEAGYVAVGIVVTTNGKALASENIIIFFSILFLILIAGLLSLLIYDITRFATMDFDVRDVIFNLSAYFVLFGTYMLEQEYMANANIERFLEMLVTAGAYPFVYLSMIMFAVCFIVNLMKIKKENSRIK